MDFTYPRDAEDASRHLDQTSFFRKTIKVEISRRGRHAYEQFHYENDPYHRPPRDARQYYDRDGQSYYYEERGYYDMYTRDPYPYDPVPRDPYPRDPYPRDPFPLDPYPAAQQDDSRRGRTRERPRTGGRDRSRSREQATVNTNKSGRAHEQQFQKKQQTRMRSNSNVTPAGKERTPVVVRTPHRVKINKLPSDCKLDELKDFLKKVIGEVAFMSWLDSNHDEVIVEFYAAAMIQKAIDSLKESGNRYLGAFALHVEAELTPLDELNKKLEAVNKVATTTTVSVAAVKQELESLQHTITDDENLVDYSE